LNDKKIRNAAQTFGSVIFVGIAWKYYSYKGRNHRTGKIVEVKPKKLPVFKVGRELKQRVAVK